MRLIDADVLKKRMCTQCNIEMEDQPCEPDDCFVRTVIMDCPTIDAVPVIRCKNCKYYNLQALACTHDNFNGWIGKDGFCSYGEPRGERKE